MNNSLISPRYAGELDPQFSQMPEFPGWVDILRALDWPVGRDLFFSSVAPTTDGHLYVCGYFAETVEHPVEYFITRLQEDGRRDITFGGDGYIRGTFPINFKMIIPTRVVVQTNGRILMQVLGYAGSLEAPDPVLLVARFVASGEADQGFGEQGLMRMYLPAGKYYHLSPFAGDMQLLPDGRILASNNGMRPTPEGLKESAIVYRIKENGELDATFNMSGLVDLAPAGGSLRVVQLLAQPDGKIVVAGYITHQAAGHASGMFARLDNEGRLDTTFGPLGTGFFEFALEGYDLQVNSLVMRPNGSLVGVGTCSAVVPDRALDDQGFIMALTAEGSPDMTFNNGDLLITLINERYSVEWITAQLQRDGKLLTAGRSHPLQVSYDTYIYLARYNPDGTPDITFGPSGTGLVETRVGGFNDLPMEIRQQADDKIVIGVNAGSFRKGIVLRYLNG